MIDPFLIEGPACISFSGGRTSAYMLRRILDAHGGALPPDVHVIFANTGKERTETLDFVHECEQRWDVRVRWIELDIWPAFLVPSGVCLDWTEVATSDDADVMRAAKVSLSPSLAHLWREVSYETASRNGEPFSAMIKARSFLPNPVMRICTQELKIRPMAKFARFDLGFEHWSNIIGLRADEPRRVAKTTAENAERWENECPLACAGATQADVMSFWGRQPFDLRLMPHEGNCDLCFLKGKAKIARLIRARPWSADWWIEKEPTANVDMRFRHDRPSYAQMRDTIERTPLLPMFDDEDALPCACTD